MTLLFVIEQLRAGGKERRLVQLAKSLTVQYPEIELHLVLNRDAIMYRDIEQTNVMIHILPPANNIKLYFLYRKLLQEIHPDIVQCWSVKSAFYFSVFRLFFKYKFISSHIADSFGMQGLGEKFYHKLIYWKADRIVGNSQAGLIAYKAPVFKSCVIYNGFDFSRFRQIEKPKVVRQSLNIQTPYLVFMAATVYKHKDYKSFLEAARIILSERKDITFVSAGKGTLLEYYRNQLQEEEKIYIRFLGHREDVDSLIYACDIGLLCSFSEGLSNSILEYMIHKKPVIATGVGGTAEIVKDGKNGYLLPASAPELLAQKITALIDDPDARKQMGELGYSFVMAKFTSEQSLKSYIKEYENLIGHESNS